MSEPLISVIIPTCHRNDDLARCLERLAPGRQEEGIERGAERIEQRGGERLGDGRTGQREEEKLVGHKSRSTDQMPYSLPFALDQTYEVIVSDDGWESTAETMIRDRFPWVRWVGGPKRGPAANRNRGASRAGGQWLAFTDDDCLPCASWLLGFVSVIRDESSEQRTVLEGRTVSDGPKRHPLEDAPVNETGGLLWSCNLCIRKETFETVGGFDERFPYAAMEDMDFRLRLEGCGIKARFVPDATVVHPWKRQDLRRHWRRHLKSLMIFLRLHPEQDYRFTLGFHFRTVARYYGKQFPAEVRQFGWAALSCQPWRWYQFLLYAWVYWHRPEPEKMRV